MPLTRSQEIAIRAAAVQAQALSQSLMALIARDDPPAVRRCINPDCNSDDLAEAGQDLVCADCNTNQPR